MLDRMAVLMPQWTERHAADLGVALVELLAFVGDYLSYQQDAVATEAYLGTARRRVSVRRHARLVDYSMHDGCNARTWVQVRVRDDVNDLLLRRSTGTNITKVLTRIADQPHLITPVVGVPKGIGSRPEVFELLHDVTLFAAHNTLLFYTWGCVSAVCLAGRPGPPYRAAIRTCNRAIFSFSPKYAVRKPASRKTLTPRIVMRCSCSASP